MVGDVVGVDVRVTEVGRIRIGRCTSVDCSDG